MARVLVLWADPLSANLGVRVLAEGAEAVAQAVFGADAQIDHQDFGSWALGAQLHKKSVTLDRIGLNRTWRRALTNYEFVFDTGAGDSLTDIYGLERLFVMTEVQRAVVREGIPLILLPQTIGPFRTGLSRTLARTPIRRAQFVATRDSASGSYLARAFARISQPATDLVFALPPAGGETPCPPDVVLNVSGLLWGPNPHVDHQVYRRLIDQVIRDFDAAGRSVTLLAHVLDNPSPDNDLRAIDALSVTFPKLPIVVPETLSAVRKLVASATVVVGSRMHACLNAISVGTPAVPLAYSRKFAPLLADIGWPHTLDLRGALDAQAVLEMADQPRLGADLAAVVQRANHRHAEFLAALKGVLT